MKETDPVNIILVKHGSKGDRLLFRYPFSEIIRERKKQAAAARIKPYALVSSVTEDNTRQPPISNISNGQLVGFPDIVLSNLFAVTAQLSQQKFELKVNDVRFVGHPTLLQSAQVSPKRLTSTLILFHIVFALPANASYSVVRCYHDLSYRLGVCLRHEERRRGYLSKETKIMLAAHDEISTLSEESKESVFDIILQRSQLARDLKYIYDELCSSGVIQMRINRWLQISFCLPQRIHSFNRTEHVLDPESLDRCINCLKPYHALLLLVSECDFVSSLPLGASPALVRLIQASSPLKSLQELAIDADLSITQVFRLVGHLIYWAKATIIYPLCETNVYILSPHAPTHINSTLVDEFAFKFPGVNLLIVMAEFSLPVSLSQRGNPTHIAYQQTQLLQIVIWMLQHNLLMQLHTYIYYIPTDEHAFSRPPSRGSSSSEWSRNRLDLTIDIDDTNWSNLPSSISSPSPGSSSNPNPSSRLQNENSDDFRLFDRLRRYFCGKHHLEEIMYYENIRRTQLLFLLDKLRDILITCEHEDDAVAMFYKHAKTWS